MGLTPSVVLGSRALVLWIERGNNKRRKALIFVRAVNKVCWLDKGQ